MGPLIEAADLHVAYRRSRIGLAGVELAVAPGDIVAVLGPNGSGKSTLVRTIAGDLRPSRGTLRVATDSIGWAPDEAVHVDALNARENARLFARANGGDKAVGAVPGLLETFALADDAHRPAGELSFGQRRKLMLVQALAHAPSLLLLDEPTVGLDPPGIDALFGNVRAAASRGGAVVFASNDVGAAAAVASRILFLRAGRKLADDTPDALLRAVRGSTRIEIDAPAPKPDVAFPQAVHAVATDHGWLLETDAGTSVLPSVCDAIASAGAHITAIRVHEIDLSDAFRALTGEDWRPDRSEAA